MRFHVVSLPHTHTTSSFPACAFTQKVVRFTKMMMDLGHEVFLYAGEQNEAECTEHISCISEQLRQEIIPENHHYTAADWAHPNCNVFLTNTIEAMRDRIQDQDFICLIGGLAHKPIADAFPEHLSVEFGIGYPGTFAKYRVFESYAWMHMIYGAETGGDAGAADGRWFDAVIPNQVDDDLYSLGSGGDYALYVGRLIDRKGYRIAQEVCERKGVRLILAGPGEASGYGEFVGEVDAKTRVRLMSGAKCLFVPTQYIEPFGTVHIEAMACGTPVITSDFGVFTETVTNWFNGFRCRTFAEFCDALDHVDHLERSKIRYAALARYSMSVVGRQYEAYFKRLSTLWEDGWYQLSA